MTINRRQFIKQGLVTAMGAGSIGSIDSLFNQAHAAAVTPNDYKSLVCVYLNGGCDTFNMLIPYDTAGYNAYKTARSGIEYERSSLLPISSDFALNQFMPDLQNLFTNGEASFLANVGTLIRPVTKSDIINGAELPRALAAHNTQTNYWQADHTNDPSTTKDGWAGRVANEFVNNSVMPINSPIITAYNLFQSHAVQQFYKLNGTGLITPADQSLSNSGYNDRDRTARRNAMYAINAASRNDESLLVQHAATQFEQGLTLNLDAQTAISDVNFVTDFPNHAEAFKTAAKMIAIRESLQLRRQIFYIQINGFDNHTNQNATYNTNMKNLSEGLSAFNAAMHELDVHDSVVTFTASEFGRTLATNWNGTDHAWGGNHIIMGGPVVGKTIFGNYPLLEIGGQDDFTNNTGRMIPTSSVTQYSSTIAKWFGVPDERLASVFPNLSNYQNNADLGIFG